MSRSSRSICFILPFAVLLLAMHSPAQQPGAGNTTHQDSSDFGAGGHRDQDPVTSSGMLRGRVYDAQGTLRQTETDTYSPTDSKLKTERNLLDFDLKGHLNFSVDYKYDLHGALSTTDFTHYGLHGERTWEETTDYRSDGYEIQGWSLGTHSWMTDFNPYKFPKATAAGTPPPLSTAPSSVDVGVIVPRDYHPGDNILGSLHLSSYADNFKVVPGFSVYDFPIQLYHLPDGSPEWSSLEIGVKGDGYYPVNADGTFSLHIPMSWKGPLQLQALQPDPLTGIGPSSGILDMGNPVVAPTLPAYDNPAKIQLGMQYFATDHLVDLWNEAYDREVELDEAYDNPNYSDEEIDDLEYDLDDCYDEIDHVVSTLPTDVVVKLARGLAHDSEDYSAWLSGQPNLTADDKDDIRDSNGWASFLHDEAGYASFVAIWGSQPTVQPFWTTPVLSQGKLGVIRGTFDDPNSFYLGIDKTPIPLIAATPSDTYFLPPSSLTAGLHNYILDSQLYGETTLPVFYMTLTMWADQLDLHKGQSTTYHVKLDGTNGLPGGAWSSPFYPTDLVARPTSSGNSSLTGSITLEVTNQSRATITMQDEFRTLDASNFVPSGSYQLDGGVHAIKDGDFSIYGEARAYLQPELGLGTSAPPSTYGTGGSAWIPGLGWSYDRSWANNSPLLKLLNTCSPEGAAVSPPCMDKQAQTIYDQAIGNQPGTQVPDPTQLPEATKRAEDARRNFKEAGTHLLTAEAAETAAWNSALSNVPREVVDERTKASANLHKAEYDRKQFKTKYDANPNNENANLLGAADQDVADATPAEQVARAKLFDSFKPDDRKAYSAAHEALRKARTDLDAAYEEDRAAGAALEKLKQAALNH